MFFVTFFFRQLFWFFLCDHIWARSHTHPPTAGSPGRWWRGRQVFLRLLTEPSWQQLNSILPNIWIIWPKVLIYLAIFLKVIRPSIQNILQYIWICPVKSLNLSWKRFKLLLSDVWIYPLAIHLSLVTPDGWQRSRGRRGSLPVPRCSQKIYSHMVSILLYHSTTYSQKEKFPRFTRPDGLIDKNLCRNATQLL